MNEQNQLRRIRRMTWLFIFGLVISGVTAMPLETELRWLTNLLGLHAGPAPTAGLGAWLLRVETALTATSQAYPFIAYGFDWLAFGHLMIALAFIGTIRDPVRNVWLYEFGLWACALVIPWALICGEVRGIPWGWRLIDCSFGVIGAVPLWWCRNRVRELENSREETTDGHE